MIVQPAVLSGLGLGLLDGWMRMRGEGPFPCLFRSAKSSQHASQPVPGCCCCCCASICYCCMTKTYATHSCWATNGG